MFLCAFAFKLLLAALFMLLCAAVLRLELNLYRSLALGVSDFGLATLCQYDFLQPGGIGQVQLLQFLQAAEVYHCLRSVAYRESGEIGEILQEGIVGDDVAATASVKHEHCSCGCLIVCHYAVAVCVTRLEALRVDVVVFYLDKLATVLSFCCHHCHDAQQYYCCPLHRFRFFSLYILLFSFSFMGIFMLWHVLSFSCCKDNYSFCPYKGEFLYLCVGKSLSCYASANTRPSLRVTCSLVYSEWKSFFKRSR